MAGSIVVVVVVVVVVVIISSSRQWIDRWIRYVTPTLALPTQQVSVATPRP